MAMFTKEEAFCFIKDKLEVIDAEDRMTTDKKSLLNDLTVAIQEHIPFQNLSLLSIPPAERCQPNLDQIKSDFVSGIGGLCFSLNTCGFYLFKAIGFDVSLAHSTCSTTIKFKNNHVVIYVTNVEKPGDKYFVDLGLGMPTFEAINLDFERESPIYVSSFLEYKFVKYDGKLLRMHRKGDPFTNPNRERNPEIDFWIDDFRRFYDVELDSTTDFSEFDKCYREIYLNPKASPFHTSHRFTIFKGRKAFIIVNGNTRNENDNGELESKEILGGDDGIAATIRNICPNFPEDIIRNSLHQWRNS